ncbi:pyridoxal phosphate-dependent aminotransferase [Anaeromyxobacter dehalogenans]|uniref:Histidinol phosphate aminotransferase apoenzyme n=1 Tax=Anaeromyxobacter dehalogenans (strain 2CP-C) TaxID=290397 RepID=Q2IH07_ANADE|nr:histidinol-phosphate transaminase [Anaeromyxobacter dehalogenans]ABC83867.1 histidinol phosphate aminotransferase apoenzyme [Anaeromyxobacter dehalogenans 2CP-C]
MNAFKPHLASVADYPYAKVDARLKLDQNESPDDLPPDLKARALERIARAAWNRYPELHAEDVRAAVARHEGWDPQGVVLAPGSNLLVLALTQAARAVVDTVPAFPYYKGGSVATGTPWRGIPLAPGFAIPMDALLAAMDGAGGVLFLPNPHAPTGQLFATGDVERLADRARQQGWVLVVDEAYHAFAGSDARPLARANEHVAVLRTFSKSWCLGGVRAGYLLASPKVAAVVRACLPPFCIPVHTGAILQTVLEAPGYVGELVQRIQAERARVLAALSAHPTWRPYPSAANYLLVRTPDAKAAWEHLLARGILVRRQDHYAGLEGCIRITVGTRAENDALLAAAADAP